MKNYCLNHRSSISAQSDTPGMRQQCPDTHQGTGRRCSTPLNPKEQLLVTPIHF